MPRTTLAIDADVLAAARAVAARERSSLGMVISDLARRSLKPPVQSGETRNGVPLLPVKPGAGPVTPELIRELDDEIP